MKRRNFLKLIAGAAAAVATGAAAVTKKVIPGLGMQINPAWIAAESSSTFIFNPAVFSVLTMEDASVAMRGDMRIRIQEFLEGEPPFTPEDLT